MSAKAMSSQSQRLGHPDGKPEFSGAHPYPQGLRRVRTTGGCALRFPRFVCKRGGAGMNSTLGLEEPIQLINERRSVRVCQALGHEEPTQTSPKFLSPDRQCVSEAPDPLVVIG